MDTLSLLAAVAEVLAARKTDLGLEGVSFPAIPTVPKSPWAMVRLTNRVPQEGGKERATQQVHRPVIEIVLLVRGIGNPADAARLYPIPNKILDLFDGSTYGGNVNAAFAGTSLTGSVDRIWHTYGLSLDAVNWFEAGPCYGAFLTLDAQYRRTPEGI